MNIQTSIKPAVIAKPALKAAQTTEVSTPSVNVDAFESSSVGSTALKAALIGAAYGALVGGSTNALYSNASLMTATGVHAGGILAGGALGAAVLSKPLMKKAEAPAAYALGALAGAGATWGTSAFGLLHNPVVGIVAGAALGAFYGAVGGAIIASKGSNDRPVSAFAPKPSYTLAGDKEEPKFPKGAWTGISVAYAAGGTAITAAMIAMGVAGRLTPGGALAGGLVAAGAYANAYLTYKTAQHKG